MSTRLKRSAVVLVVVFAAVQLVGRGQVNVATDDSRTIGAHVGTASGLVAVLDRSCSNCHSNTATWPWYGQIAPLSWVLARGVAEGRQAVNFSEWGTYSPTQQRDLLAASCQAASDGTMPGRAYTLLRPEARLSAEDVKTICAAAGRL